MKQKNTIDIILIIPFLLIVIILIINNRMDHFAKQQRGKLQDKVYLIKTEELLLEKEEKKSQIQKIKKILKKY